MNLFSSLTDSMYGELIARFDKIHQHISEPHSIYANCPYNHSWSNSNCLVYPSLMHNRLQLYIQLLAITTIRHELFTSPSYDYALISPHISIPNASSPLTSLTQQTSTTHIHNTNACSVRKPLHNAALYFVRKGFCHTPILKAQNPLPSAAITEKLASVTSTPKKI